MIRLKNLTIGYGANVLLRDISADFPSGQLVALLGRNGTGKSTLLRVMAGLIPKLGGEIFLSGKRQTDMNLAERARQVSMVTTERIRIPYLRCKDLVALGRSPYTNWIGRMRSEDEAEIEQALHAVGMADYAAKTMNCMSDGECQRIMIARALVQNTPVVLLDEPTSFLDMPNRYELGLLLRRLAHEKQKCIVFSTHELDIALNLCDSIALIENPDIHHDTVANMVDSGCIERLFQNGTVWFDARAQQVRFK